MERGRELKEIERGRICRIPYKETVRKTGRDRRGKPGLREMENEKGESRRSIA